jgi:hypothetical protein
MTEYFKELSNQCKEYHKKGPFDREFYLYDIGFDYAEALKIMSYRKHSNPRNERIIKELDSGKYCTRIGMYRKFKISSSQLSQVLNGDIKDTGLIDKIEATINRAKRRHEKV